MLQSADADDDQKFMDSLGWKASASPAPIKANPIAANVQSHTYDATGPMFTRKDGFILYHTCVVSIPVAMAVRCCVCIDEYYLLRCV